jgi:hypothetical protein
MEAGNTRGHLAGASPVRPDNPQASATPESEGSSVPRNVLGV